MARIPEVTRTITSTKCIILVADLENNVTVTEEVSVPRTYKDDTHLLKAVKKTYDTDEKIAVKIISSDIVETLYGMLETDFVKYAHILPPRGTGKIDTNNLYPSVSE